MATIDQVRVLSTPKVMVDGKTIKIEANSCEVQIGGAGKVRAVSSGGDSTEIVHGVDASEFKAHVKFSVPATAEMVEFTRSLRDKANHSIASTVRVIEDHHQFAFDTMFMVNKPTIKYSAEGTIDVEMEGKHVP